MLGLAEPAFEALIELLEKVDVKEIPRDAITDIGNYHAIFTYIKIKNFLFMMEIQVVPISTTLSFSVVKSSLAKCQQSLTELNLSGRGLKPSIAKQKKKIG